MSCTEAELARAKRRRSDPEYQAWRKAYMKEYWKTYGKKRRTSRELPPAGYTDCEGRYRIGI